MTECYQIQNVLLLIEFLDDAVIAGAQPMFRPASEAVMWVSAQARTGVMNLGLDWLADAWR